MWVGTDSRPSRVISVPGPGPCERVLVLGAGRLISVPGPGPCERVLILGAGCLISVPGHGPFARFCNLMCERAYIAI